MPKRPKQHRLEDKSRIKFQDVLPEMWVFRDKDKDYGIDAEVELFGQNEKSQGLVFWVQLKATESKEKSTILNIDLDIDTLRYYKSLDIPVLLVRYSDCDSSIYTIWINNVDLFFAKKRAKTFRIKLTKNDKWNNTTHNEIENYLKKVRLLKSGSFGFPLPITISINEEKVNGFSRGVLIAQIKKELKNYSEFITIQSNSEKSLFKVSLENNELKIDALNIAGCSFHSIKSRDKDDFSNNITKDIVIGIAISMIHLGQVEYFGRIIFENNLKSRLITKKELFDFFIIPLFHSSFFNEAISIFEEISDDENHIGLNIISNFHMFLVASKTKNEEKNVAIERFLKKQIDNAIAKNDNQLIGIANYNIGNHYNSRNKFLHAIHHFNLARKFETIYLKQSYFFSELASVLFRYGKYKYASIFYSKSLELNHEIRTIALYADSLLFSGEYKKAKEQFDDYLKNAEKPVDEFILKSNLLETILEEFKIDKQIRNRKEANKYAEIKINITYTKLIEQLEKALSFDLLSGLAWFNLGVTYNKKDNYNEAFICFTMSALINTWDTGAWINATILSFTSKINISFLPLIMKTAFFYNSEDFLEKLYSELEAQGNSEFVNLFSEVIEEFLPKQEKIEPPTVRILNDKGKFESIEEIIKGHNNV